MMKGSDEQHEMIYTKGEIEYFLRHAGFRDIGAQPLDVLTRGWMRLTIRRLARRLAIEDRLLDTLYLFSANA